MSPLRLTTSVDRREFAAVLSDRRHRRLLSLLAAHEAPLDAEALTAELASTERAAPPTAPPAADSDALRLDLHHRLLPKLETMGLVEHCPDGYRLVADFPMTVPGCDIPLDPTAATPPTVSWDLLAALVAEPVRQHILAAVEEDGPLALDPLARAVLTRRDAEGATVQAQTPDRLAMTLHHRDLPQLAALGALAYDPAARRVWPVVGATGAP